MVILFTQLVVSYINTACNVKLIHLSFFITKTLDSISSLWLHIQKGERMGEHNSKQIQKIFLLRNKASYLF